VSALTKISYVTRIPTMIRTPCLTRISIENWTPISNSPIEIRIPTLNGTLMGDSFLSLTRIPIQSKIPNEIRVSIHIRRMMIRSQLF
jgi:hypothetical protein